MTESCRPIRLLVADDHQSIRIALLKLFATEPDIEVVGLAVDGEQAVSLADSLEPDVVLMDVNMPTLDGVEATRRIVERNPLLRVVTLTASRTRHDEARRAGAIGHVLKDAPPGELIRSIRTAVAPSPASPEVRADLL